jgi:hypothetical protein
VTSDDDTNSTEIEDLRPPDYWGRHPFTKVLIFGSLGAGIAGGRFVGGDGGTLLLGGGCLVFATVALLGSIDQMRGLVSPLPGRDMKLLSPLAAIAGAAAFIVAGVLMLATVALDVNEGERPGWLVVLGVVALALVVLGLMIQIGSLSDQWPDKWRPPYARQQADDAPATGSEPESAQPSRSDERP